MPRGATVVGTAVSRRVAAVGTKISLRILDINNNVVYTATGNKVGVWNQGQITSTAPVADLSLLSVLDLGDNAITSLAGLQGLVSVGGGFQVRECGALAAVGQPMALQSVGDYFYFTNDPVLLDMSGFGVLQSVGAELVVSDNAVLATMGTFPALGTVGTDFFVQNNPQLPTCQPVTVLQQLGGVPGSTIISGNLPDACGG